MRKKNFLEAALVVAAGMMILASCGENEVINSIEQGCSPAQGKATVKLVCSPYSIGQLYPCIHGVKW